MRLLPVISSIVLVAALPAGAQVTVDLRALQAVPERPASSRPVQAAPVPRAPVAGAPAAAANTAMPDSKLPLPETAPGVASVDPIPAAPQIGVPPAPVLSDKAAVGLSPKTAGLRLTFAAGEAELSPDSAAAIKQTVGKAPSGDNVTFEVFAYASGKSDDQSSARRLSLSRAMAVRGVLTAGGIPSARIFIRAMGENAGDGPADRVDLNISGPSKAATQ